MAKFIAPIIAVGAGLLTGIGVGAVAATVIATVVVGVAVAAGAVAIANKLQKSMTPELGSAAEFAAQGAQGIMVNKTGSSQSIPVIYGKTRTGGTRVYAETDTEVGDYKNAYLRLVYVIGEGEMNRCTKIYFDGVEAGSQTGTGAQDWADDKIISKYRGKVKMYFRPGTDGQSAISDLTNNSGFSSPKFSGIAYAYLRLEYDEDIWKNGLPEVTFEVEGVKVPSTSDGTSLSYTNGDNPANCVLNYLVNTRYGKGIPPADLDLASFESARAYCDGRFECRGNVSTNGTIHANIIDLLSSCRGYIAFGNKYRMLIDRASSETPFEITKDNTVGDVDYILGDKGTLFNKMTARYLDQDTEYKDNVKVLDSSALRTKDNGLVLETEIPMPFVKTTSKVNQILHEEINQSRQTHMIRMQCTVDAIDLQVGDLVNVTNETFGITSKTFRVLNTIIEPSSEIGLILREYDADVYNTSSTIITDELADNN